MSEEPETPKKFVQRPIRWNRRAADAITTMKAQQEHIAKITQAYIDACAKAIVATEDLAEERAKNSMLANELKRAQEQVRALDDQLSMQAMYYQKGEAY